MKKILTVLTTAVMVTAFMSCKEKDKNISVTSITLNKTLDTLALGQTLLLEPVLLPQNATNQNVNWLSSNDSIATVIGGSVTALALGSVTITVTTQDGNKTDTCRIVASNAKNQNCNMFTPGWGTSLGTISFATTEIWIIPAAHGISQQVWSDAVQAVNCGNRTTFVGGTTDNFNADCRSNPDQKGDLFSWCAVIRFQDLLCPGDWRVPTMQDFINLDIAMGGSGNNGLGSLEIINLTYVAQWGGVFGGTCLPDGSLSNQGFWGSYWSQTESGVSARFLALDANGGRGPQRSSARNHGYTLRCVRN